MRSLGRRAGFALALSVGLLAGLAPPAAADPALVLTGSGPVRGTVTRDYREFNGIPYAAPPVGDLRWRAPRPARPWTAPRDATKPGANCAQNAGFSGESLAEDCLFVNVTAPRRARNRPVMVWFHGGGFQNGAGAEYRATELATRGDVVVVTVNYRLGIFGFLAHPAFDAGQGLSGNFGLEDQQAALRWVRRNAAAFGGDAGNVTIFGESSGGRSVCAQLAAPAAAGLFQRAIVQSEPCTMLNWPEADGKPSTDPPGFPKPRASAEQQGQAVATALGCPDPATAAVCLRGKDTAAVLKQASYWYAPVFGGGGVLPLDPAEAVATGRFAKVPVLHGINRDEFRIGPAFDEVLAGKKPITPDEYRSLARNFAGDRVDEVLARYPVTAGRSASEAWSAVVTDATFARAATEMNHALARQVPAYAYEFADEQAPWLSGMAKPSFPPGAYHLAELQYLFAVTGFDGPGTAAQKRLAEQLIRYWARFAHTGNPNGPGSPFWPRADQNPGLAQVLAPDGVRPESFTERHQYGYWRTGIPQ
ncbi:carboxylesterase/lipase family protein [Amycolatopsis anabasis]|uniref:carboxylesterase/lipase family protein n=1 Tax=Amycolatopsis anabasis TaxID=1840409 RepID=UPI00131AB975|nr:carboxylesterase family protein [Amycolatopsis anabasis]